MKNLGFSTVRVYFLLAMLTGAFAFGASGPEDVSVSGRINLNDDYVVYFGGKGDASNASEEMILNADGSFSWKGKAEAPFFMTIGFFPKTRDLQMPASFTLFVEPGKHLQVDLSYSKETLLTLNKSNLDADNLALMNYSTFYHRQMMDLWKDPPATDKRMEASSSFTNKAAELASTYKVSNATVLKYLKLWSYTHFLDAAHSPAMSGRDNGPALNKEVKYPSDMAKIFDDPMALYFPSTSSHLLKYVNDHLQQDIRGLKRFDQTALQIEGIMSQFNHPVVRNALISLLLDRYIRGFRLEEGMVFTEEIDRFSQLAKKMHGRQSSDRFIEKFSGLRFTLPEADLPDVVLRDTAGKEVRLKSFKGSYVYIDFWASWCVPCIKEVPHLQQLEKAYEGKNIKFVSITLDTNKKAWKEKMKELNLHGHQLDGAGSGIDDMLNITGIPRFVLYSPEGKLMMLSAPRPSSKQIREIFDRIN